MQNEMLNEQVNELEQNVQDTSVETKPEQPAVVTEESKDEANVEGGENARPRRESRPPRDGSSTGSRERRTGGPRRERRRERTEKQDNIQERVIHIGRVAKTVKGGRNFRFTALVITGDGEGRVGKGLGKAAEIPDAIRKGVDEARKSMIKVPLNGTTIPHEIMGKFGSGKVLLRPAPEGTGVIAGGPVRAICELAGIKDIVTKSLGTNNANNMANAAIQGLLSLRSAEEVAKLRGKSVEEIL